MSLLHHILSLIMLAASPVLAQSPVIICDPAETNCVESRPTLGPLFDIAQWAVICSQNDPRECTESLPQLGPRFTGIDPDVRPDIRPGECSVLEDKSYAIYQNVEPVETTYCEVGDYEEKVERKAPTPAKAGSITPPDLSHLDGSSAVIDVDQVRGIPCGGRPGDPYWASDCSCNCDDVLDSGGDPIPKQERDGVDYGIEPDCIDENGEFFIPEGRAELDCFFELDDTANVSDCADVKDITRHDIAITSADECRQDLENDDHFLP